MGNTHWGYLGIRLVSICIFLVMMAHKCVADGNLTTTTCSKQERLALLKFKQSVTDETGMLSSWGVGDDYCRWEGVGCDDATRKVVSLKLGRNFKEDSYLAYGEEEELFIEDYTIVGPYYLVGDGLNSCLRELVNLEHLDLSGNNFHGRIPKFIGSLKQLRYLNLSNAGFYGNIPHQIANLSNLKVLDLSSSPFLMMDDMAWVSGLSKLEHLDLSEIDLSRTQNLHNLPYMIPSLLKLCLSRCGLSMVHLSSHHINSSRKLLSIKHLDLSYNDFSGQLPGLFLNMTSLVFLDLSCHSSVSMSWRYINLLNMIPSVSRLHLSSCGIQNIHLSTTNLNFSTHFNIQHLDLDRNEIEGRFPYVLTNMSSLLSLELSTNKLNSSIPFMPNLLKLGISWNKFRHIDDIGIWRQCNLKELTGSGNHLTGEMISLSSNVSECSHHALEILDLDHTTLKCIIPEALGRLTNLRGLYLSFNELTGPIPEAIGKLRSLQELDLSQNQLSGSIPESLGRLTTLTDMFMMSNRFTGSIPLSLGRLTSLRVLSLSHNLLNGTIPSSVGQLNKLYLLDVSHNSLQGVVSEAHFANLLMLKHLYANDNSKLFFNISREWIPPFQLNALRLASCKIEDEFPQWLRTQRNLRKLVLSNTSIYGPLPAWLSLMPMMSVLDLSHNKLSGPLINIPSKHEFRYLNGGILLLQDNLFRGSIPRRLCALTHLQVLDLSINRLTGQIPKCLWNISHMDTMLLGSNRLSGVISSSLGTQFLRFLQLSDNNFTGELPRDVGCFKYLRVMDFGENKISGIIPKWIGEKMTNLVALRLHKNNFTGSIPHSLCKSMALQILDLAHNNLTGSIPHCFEELNAMKKNFNWDGYRPFLSHYENMRQVLKGVVLSYTKTLHFLINMDLSRNKLVGEVPEALMTLDALVGLNLSYNHFNGVIPKSIGNMTSLNSLDFSANELTGMIPPSITTLNFLSYLNLSHNNLSGRIPTGYQLQTLTDPSIYAYNTYLCGAPLPKECNPHENPPTTTSKKQHENGKGQNNVWFYLDIMSGFATGFWGIIGVLMFKTQWRLNFFMFCEETKDKIYIAVAIRVLKMKRGGNIFK